MRLGRMACVLCLLLLCACAPEATPTPNPCGQTVVMIYVQRASLIMSRFGDTVKAAGSTARTSVAPLVTTMQDYRRSFVGVSPVPPCLDEYASLTRQGMDETIAAYAAFGRAEPDATVSAHLANSGNYMALSNQKLAEVLALLRQ